MMILSKGNIIIIIILGGGVDPLVVPSEDVVDDDTKRRSPFPHGSLYFIIHKAKPGYEVGDHGGEEQTAKFLHQLRKADLGRGGGARRR